MRFYVYHSDYDTKHTNIAVLANNPEKADEYFADYLEKNGEPFFRKNDWTVDVRLGKLGIINGVD